MKDLFPIDHDKPFMGYMGGKQHHKKKIMSYVPPDLKLMVSPFIGSGSVELYAAAKGIRVIAYDNFPSLVRHWNIMLENAGEVIRMANKMFPVKQSILKNLIVSEKINSKDAFPNGFPSPEYDIIFAAICMCMARQGYNNMYLKRCYFRDKDIGDKVLERFKPWDEDYWDNWGNSNIKIDCLDWQETLKRHKTDFIFCDPPYVGNEDYYGQYETKKTKYKSKPFNHELLAQEFAAHENGGILTYQDDDKGVVRSLYKDFEIIEWKPHQGSRSCQGVDNAIELIILKEPAIRPSKRSGRHRSKIGNPRDISRLYGKWFSLPDEDITVENSTPENLCEWMEKEFSCFNPLYPSWKSLDILFLDCPYNRYTCDESDIRGIIGILLEIGIIEEHEGAHKGSIYYGYPKFEVKDMNAHIENMKKAGISVKATPHFSYDYDDTR